MSTLFRAFEIIVLDPATPEGVNAIYSPDKDHIALQVQNGIEAKIEQALSLPGELKAILVQGGQSRLLLLNRISIIAFITLISALPNQSQSLNPYHWVLDHTPNTRNWITVSNHVHLLDVQEQPPQKAPTRIKLSFHKGKWVAHQVLGNTLRTYQVQLQGQGHDPPKDKDHLSYLKRQVEARLLQDALQRQTHPHLHPDKTIIRIHGALWLLAQEPPPPRF